MTFSFDPTFFHFGAAEIGWHGLFTALAVFAGVWLGVRGVKALGVRSDALGSVAGWAIAGGIVGARLFHVLDHLSYFSQRPVEVFAVWEGGIAVYGAFIGGTLSGALAARSHGLPVWKVLDGTAPAVLVSQMIGRLGCLSNGDAWGEPTGGDWGIVYTDPNALLPSSLLGVPTHPYPLYEMIATTVLLGVMWASRRKLRSPGDMFLAAAMGYAVIRFSLTFFRQEAVLFWGLQEAQVVAIATGAVAVGVAIYNRRRQSDSFGGGGREHGAPRGAWSKEAH